MNFRILSNDESEKDSKNKREEYIQYLKKFNKKKQKDLWSFFETDFFHDGQIKDVCFSVNMQTIAFKVSCSNIKRNNNNSLAYIKPVWFTCRFEGVVEFHLETKKLDGINNPISESEIKVLFLESEINTLTEELGKYNNLYNDEFFSIIIKTLPTERDFSIIFQSLKVEAEEPLAFELMKQDKSFEIPLVKLGE